MATTITKTEKLVGKKIRRREDPRLITGTATYLDDIKMPGMHHAIVVRSPHAAAKIKGIDTKAAAGLPGVVAIFTGADVAKLGAVPCAASLPGLRVPHHHLLAQDRVYYVGHPVAVVVATDRYIARDAADMVEVDYDVLPAVADPEKALAPARRRFIPNGRTTWPSRSTRRAAMWNRRSAMPRWSSSSASPASGSFRPRWRRAGWSRSGARASESMTMYSSTQIPHLLRTHGGGDSRHAGEPAPRHHARSRRRLRVEAQRLRRGSADVLHREADRQAGEVGGIAPREFHVHDPRARPCRLLRAGGEA